MNITELIISIICFNISYPIANITAKITEWIIGNKMPILIPSIIIIVMNGLIGTILYKKIIKLTKRSAQAPSEFESSNDEKEQKDE